MTGALQTLATSAAVSASSWRRWSGLGAALALAGVGALLSAQWQPAAEAPDQRTLAPSTSPQQGGVIDVALPAWAALPCKGEAHVASI